jgi:hypothetical protein
VWLYNIYHSCVFSVLEIINITHGTAAQNTKDTFSNVSIATLKCQNRVQWQTLIRGCWTSCDVSCLSFKTTSTLSSV